MSKYTIGLGEDGMTDKERLVVLGLSQKKSFRQIGAGIDITPQRVHQLAQQLVKKGALSRDEAGYAVQISIADNPAFTALVAAQNAQDPTTPGDISHEATKEAHA